MVMLFSVERDNRRVEGAPVKARFSRPVEAVEAVSKKSFDPS